MSWAIGYDNHWKRDIGYGVPAICDHPKCIKKIDRGLGYVCGGEPYGGEYGCGLYFCGEHLVYHKFRGALTMVQACKACFAHYKKHYIPKPDVKEWMEHKLTDESWKKWRKNNPEEVEKIKELML